VAFSHLQKTVTKGLDTKLQAGQAGRVVRSLGWSVVLLPAGR
jgi:hypothetical protein